MHTLIRLVETMRMLYDIPVMVPRLRLCLGAVLTLAQDYCVAAQQSAMILFIAGEFR